MVIEENNKMFFDAKELLAERKQMGIDISRANVRKSTTRYEMTTWKNKRIALDKRLAILGARMIIMFIEFKKQNEDLYDQYFLFDISYKDIKLRENEDKEAFLVTFTDWDSSAPTFTHILIPYQLLEDPTGYALKRRISRVQDQLKTLDEDTYESALVIEYQIGVLSDKFKMLMESYTTHNKLRNGLT